MYIRASKYVTVKIIKACIAKKNKLFFYMLDVVSIEGACDAKNCKNHEAGYEMIKQSEVHHTTDHGFVMIMGGEAGWILKTVKAKLTNWNYEQVNVDEEYWDYVEVNANEEDCDYEQISMKEVCGYEQINMNEEDLIEYSANCLEHAFDDKRTVYEYAFGSMKQPSAVMSGNRECITSRFAVLTIIYNQNESETVIVEFVNFEDENNIEASLYYDAQS